MTSIPHKPLLALKRALNVSGIGRELKVTSLSFESGVSGKDSDNNSIEQPHVLSGRLSPVIVQLRCDGHPVDQSHYSDGGSDIEAPEDTSHHPSGLSSSEYEGNEGAL